MSKQESISNNWLYEKMILLGEVEPLEKTYSTLVGVCILPLEEYFSFDNFEPVITQSKDGNCTEVVHSLQTFVIELLRGSLTEMDILMKDDNFLVKTDFGQELLDNRHLFLSAEIYRQYLSLISHYTGMLTYENAKDYSKWKGYNTKYVTNIVNLYTNAYKILTNGKPLPSGRKLENIKRGKYKLLELYQQFTTWDLQLQLLELECGLHEEVDLEEVDTFVTYLTKKYYDI